MATRYGAKGISYTYTEPTVFFEYAYETSVLATEKNLYNTFVTNGYMSTKAIETIAPYLDGANVDLKSFNENFYKKYCGAKLKPVLENIEKMKELGIWVEVTTLIIPTLNDSEDELRQIAVFLYKLSPDIPWHVSRFHPHYKLTDPPPTPGETIKNARRIGLEVGLRYVYTGNIYDDEGSRTYCHNCKKPLIYRSGFSITKNIIKDNHCPECNSVISGMDL
jgi:pyruvate formate lyase activating enzyme